MENINHAVRMPYTEHTSNDTGRLVVYSIHRRDKIYTMIKDAILPKGIIVRDPKFLYATFDLEGLRKEMLYRGFVPMMPAPEEQNNLVCTFL